MAQWLTIADATLTHTLNGLLITYHTGHNTYTVPHYFELDIVPGIQQMQVLLFDSVQLSGFGSLTCGCRPWPAGSVCKHSVVLNCC